jgi:capsule polysaccharide export protein KpsC/LpsZ
MADWIAKTVQFFAGQPEARAERSRSVQLVIRIHPGERLTHGPSMADVVKSALPEIPENIHLIGPLEQVNTYDLMEIADLGLVYTTTTGLEMCMRGIPVIACGETHYRRRGFTLDPMSWDEYYAMIESALQRKKSLSKVQVETAWEYAYRFFFEYPFVFPWRLMHFWKDMEVWPMERVLSKEGRKEFGKTFEYLAGKTIKW